MLQIFMSLLSSDVCISVHLCTYSYAEEGTEALGGLEDSSINSNKAGKLISNPINRCCDFVWISLLLIIKGKLQCLKKKFNLHIWTKVFSGVAIVSVARRMLKKRLGEEMNFRFEKRKPGFLMYLTSIDAAHRSNVNSRILPVTWAVQRRH